MKSLLLQLYDGEISPIEQYRPKIEAYQKLHEAYYAQYTDFIHQLKDMNPPLDRIFAGIIDGQFDIVPIEMSEMFLDGFCMGAKMMIEIYQKDLPNQSK